MEWISKGEISEIKANEKRWKKERESQHKSALDRISKEEGQRFNSVADICSYVHAELDKHLKCNLCGLQLPTYSKLLSHRNSQRCKKRVCKNNGTEYIPDSQKRIVCPFCKAGIRKNYWPQHERTPKHIENEKLYYLKQSNHCCLVCDKDFSFKRDGKTINPKSRRDFKRHLKSVKHLNTMAPNCMKAGSKCSNESDASLDSCCNEPRKKEVLHVC